MSSGSNVIPRRARPGLAGLRPNTSEASHRPLVTGIPIRAILESAGAPRSEENAPPFGLPWSPGHRPTVGSLGYAFSYERGSHIQAHKPYRLALGPAWYLFGVKFDHLAT